MRNDPRRRAPASEGLERKAPGAPRGASPSDLSWVLPRSCDERPLPYSYVGEGFWRQVSQLSELMVHVCAFVRALFCSPYPPTGFQSAPCSYSTVLKASHAREHLKPGRGGGKITRLALGRFDSLVLTRDSRTKRRPTSSCKYHSMIVLVTTSHPFIKSIFVQKGGRRPTAWTTLDNLIKQS